MKKIIALMLAFAMALSLVACGDNSSDDNDDGNNDSLVSHSTERPVVVYGNDDVLVFELNTDIGSFIKACEDEAVSGLIEFKLPGFKAEFLKGDFSELSNASISWNNDREEQWGSYLYGGTGSRSFRTRYEITDDYIRIICLNHCYDISSIPTARIDVRALIDYGTETIYMGGGEFASSDEVIFINEVPEQYNQPLTIENKFSKSDFPNIELMTNYTDDYLITYSVGYDSTRISYYNEQGACVCYEDILPNDDGEFYVNQVELDIVEDSFHDSKLDEFRSILGYYQDNVGYERIDENYYYFSKPVLEFSQLTDND